MLITELLNYLISDVCFKLAGKEFGEESAHDLAGSISINVIGARSGLFSSL